MNGPDSKDYGNHPTLTPGKGAPLTMLVNSRKFWIVALAMIVIGMLTGLGKVATKDAIEFAKWIVITWIAAVAAEDGTKKLAERAPNSVVINSVPPPASQAAPNAYIPPPPPVPDDLAPESKKPE